MQTVKFIILSLFALIVPILTTCEKNPIASQKEFIEPEIILIKKHLKFTYGPSWDTTFVPPDSLPMLVVELEPYGIGKYELTNEEYEKFVKDGGYKDSEYWSIDGWNCKVNSNWSLPLYWSRDNLWLDDPYSNKKDTPVHGISYYEAEAYCRWLSVKTNENYHIPNSYQWVRAAKGPDPGTKYPWGNEYNKNFANYIPHLPDTVPLIEIFRFEEGKSIENCYNMIGNAFEICLIHQAFDSLITFPGYYSCASVTVSYGGDQYNKTMTTTSCRSIEKEWRFYALGLRIAKKINE
ncbi:SUMF1/EgtB/PvdO family nonheme iron enzyme [candidate division KSB1 bacterium]|nr:SUMF1/EgtB/PvdO family nonheme iron enzyme [candidate division KSB1 bacterium]